MASVLVTGGCGYIGSHTIVDLIDKGHDPISIDNLINSSRDSLKAAAEITGKTIHNYEVDLLDYPKLRNIFDRHKFDAIIHFAALKSVGESVNDPLNYHHNNLVGMIHLLECQQEFQVPNFIFSSSCSVYGNASRLPVTESTPIKEAESPYARTKQFCEGILTDLAAKNQTGNFIILRYFNPAGAHPSIKIGESSKNQANNLVPVVTETAIGKRRKLSVFGSDYPTRDGTCIRDYIYIMDLADAHTRALEYALDGQNDDLEIFNLGSGKGSTVLEVINAFEQVSGQALNYQLVARRAGDVVAIYADYSKANEILGWQPNHDIFTIMKTAWEWEQARSDQQG